MYQGLRGSKVVFKQRDNLMERQITILEQSKYEDFKAICDDAEGNSISNFETDLEAKRDLLATSKDLSSSHRSSEISHLRQEHLPFK